MTINNTARWKVTRPAKCSRLPPSICYQYYENYIFTRFIEIIQWVHVLCLTCWCHAKSRHHLCRKSMKYIESTHLHRWCIFSIAPYNNSKLAICKFRNGGQNGRGEVSSIRFMWFGFPQCQCHWREDDLHMILKFRTSSNIIGNNRVLQSHCIAAAVSSSFLGCPFTAQVLKIQKKHNSSIKKSKTDLNQIQCKALL